MDGEKNLKKRSVTKGLNHLIYSGALRPSPDEIIFTAKCIAEQPHPSLETFDANLYMG